MNKAISMKRKNKDYSCGYLHILLFLAVILLSSDSLIVGTNQAALAIALTKYVPFALFFVLLFWACIKRTQLNGSVFLVAVILAGLILANYIIAPGANSIKNYIHVIVIILDAFLLCSLLPLKQFIQLFEKSIFIAAVFSLVVYLLVIILPQVVARFPVITNTAGNRYYSLGLTNVWSYAIHNLTWNRNNGPFREPGVYQMYLNLALSFYLHFSNKPKLLHVAVYVLAIITTTSTTGLVALMIVGIALILYSNKISQRIKVLSVICMVSLIVFMYSGLSEKLYYAVTKLSDSSNPSTVARVGSIYANLTLWLERPILGVGIARNATEFSRIIASQYHIITVDNTNTYLYFLASFGFMFFAVIIIGAFYFAKQFRNRRAVTALTLIMLLIIFSGENLTYSLLPYVVSFYGLLYEKNHYQIVIDEPIMSHESLPDNKLAGYKKANINYWSRQLWKHW